MSGIFTIELFVFNPMHPVSFAFWGQIGKVTQNWLRPRPWWK